MDKQSIIERLKDIAGEASSANGTELVHVDIAGTKRDAVVRIYIDKEGGVSIEDCTNVSRAVEAVLDADENIIPSKYVLEVSSPGIERELYSLADFEKFMGQLAKIKTKAAINGQRTFVGIITGVDGSTIGFEDRTHGGMSFEYGDIEKANLKIDLLKEFRGK